MIVMKKITIKMTKRRKVIFNNATRRTSENMEKFFVAS